MIIGIDGNDANIEQQVGVSVYSFNILYYFQRQANEDTQFVVFLRNTPLQIMPKQTEFFQYRIIPSKPLWSQVFLPLELYIKRKVDVFFSPAHYSPRFSPVPTVVTIHDLAYYYYPHEFLKQDLYKLKNWTQYSVQKAKKVIAVSKTTKKDIMKFYGLPEEKIQVVYNGFEKKIALTTETSEILKNYSLTPEKYVLYVGTLQPRKNITTLILAFKKFHAQHTDFKLVLTGKKGWLYDKIYSIAQQAELGDSLIFTGFLPDNDVVKLYKNAFCYVLPSLYEGFGIPILEAMANNCPVLSSFASSLPEVGGDAAIYFDPENVDGIVEDLNALMNTELRQDLIEKGALQIKKFSWERCATETLEILKSAAKKI